MGGGALQGMEPAWGWSEISFTGDQGSGEASRGFY